MDKKLIIKIKIPILFITFEQTLIVLLKCYNKFYFVNFDSSNCRRK